MGLREIWIFLGGTALFIFAMNLVEESIKNLAGRSFKKFLHRLTQNKFKSLIGGTIVTALLQSSSVVLLMTLSFVGAGIIGMKNALAITLGSNLGTTLTGWIVNMVGFKAGFGSFTYVLLSITILGVFFLKNKKLKNIFRFITGFGLLFLALDFMKDSAGVLVTEFDLTRFGHLSPYLFIPLGVVITFLIQSSSATVAITLTALYNHAIPFESAVAVVIGAELGTTIKLLIGAIGGNADKKRVALGNFIYNLTMVLIAALGLKLIVWLMTGVLHINDNLTALVMFQTLINILGIIIFFPLLGFFAKLLEKTYKRTEPELKLKYIKPHAQVFADDSLLMAEKELMRLLRHTIEFNIEMMHAGRANESKHLGDIIRNIFKPFQKEGSYVYLKQLQGGIIEYLAELPSEEMNNVEVQRSALLLTVSRNIIHSAKNLKDIGHNLEELESSNNDELHHIYIMLVKQQEELYIKLNDIINANSNRLAMPELLKMQEENKSQHQRHIENTLQLLKQQKIAELDVSSLLNVHREVYSSNKAIIEVLEDLWSE